MTSDVIPLSGSTLASSETMKQKLNKDTHLAETAGANNSGIMKTSIRNIDKDDLQLKWEAAVGAKFKVVVSKKEPFIFPIIGSNIEIV